jgi:phosphatidylserine synthase
MTHLADRVMDKIVYSILFPLVAVGMMWRLAVIETVASRAELLHALFILILCIAVLMRDNFAHFIRGFVQGKGPEPEPSEFTRLRTVVAAPVGALLYAHAFYIPDGSSSPLYGWISVLANLSLRQLFVIEILFLVINFGSIANYCRKYGTPFLNELCLGDERLRRRILAVFPNALTIMNASMGLLAVFFAEQGRVREAYLLVIGAAFFDKLDGAVARRLGLTEPLPDSPPRRITVGGVLDDIADAISFCIVPAWIFYLLLGDPSQGLMAPVPVGPVAALYAVAGMARLVYFTMDQSPIPGFFKGMPTPAAALLVVAPLLVFSQATIDEPDTIRFWGGVCTGMMVLAAVTMNLYPVRYLHLGRVMDRKPWFGRFCLLLLVGSVLTPYFGHLSFFYLLLYLLSPLVTWRWLPHSAPRGR